MGWVEGVHQTHAGREYVQPLVSSYSGQASATDPALSGCHHAPHSLLLQSVGQPVTTGTGNKNKIQVSFPNLWGTAE